MKKIRGNITVPLGFKAGAVHSGIKKRKSDLALILSDEPAAAAGLFTVNRFKAAPVTLSKEYLRSKKHRAVILNSGNANCLTGKKGLIDAVLMTKRASLLIGCKASEVLICSTGIIGKKLPIGKIDKALPGLCRTLSRSNFSKAAEAIMTTDTFRKMASSSFTAGGKKVIITGIAKGAGMIEPNLATMLCIITTDAAIGKGQLRAALKEAVNSSFNNITVDGSMSTNDTVLALANGLSGVDVVSSMANYNKFMLALNTVCSELAKMMVADGEGATKFVHIEVMRAKSKVQAKNAALAIANSNLFKTMCYGENPNFGRVAAACGTVRGILPSKVDIYLNKVRAVLSGVAVCDQLPQTLFKGRDIKVTVYLNIGKAQASVYTSDLSPKYIKINAEYS
ncbi:MAG: bifunctional glutamate N-acetyltransferase/amino-acid acetyltransferase ArgJ [Candidatus Omnitrophota bacterium]